MENLLRYPMELDEQCVLLYTHYFPSPNQFLKSHWYDSFLVQDRRHLHKYARRLIQKPFPVKYYLHPSVWWHHRAVCCTLFEYHSNLLVAYPDHRRSHDNGAMYHWTFVSILLLAAIPFQFLMYAISYPVSDRGLFLRYQSRQLFLPKYFSHQQQACRQLLYPITFSLHVYLYRINKVMVVPVPHQYLENAYKAICLQ